LAQIPTGNRKPSDIRQPISTVASSRSDPSKPSAIAVPGSTGSARFCRSTTSRAIQASFVLSGRFR
jgi:hypothetical protein